MIKDFLPISKEDMTKRGFETLDFICVTGDAYIDHPSFGIAIISRALEAHGYKVGIIAQPNWKNLKDITKLGKPRLGFLVSGGNIDSMVNHYSVAKKKRSKDAYTAGGVMGKRPDRATIVYSNLIRQAYKDVPIVIGGIEASLRRLSHYDYWDNTVRRSILLDSGADLLLYGMGERSIIELADALNSSMAIQDIIFLNGTVYKTSNIDHVYDGIMLEDYYKVKKDKIAYAKSFKIQHDNTDFKKAKILIEPYNDREYIVQNTPCAPLTQAEYDDAYGRFYMRNYHHIYEKDGGVPAIEEVKYSIISNRGCFGGCNFCALTYHQGRIVQARSQKSIVNEAKQFIWDKDFKGYIHDVGGPTANFRKPSCSHQLEHGVCVDKQCLFPKPCNNLEVEHRGYLDILRELRELPNVKKVFVRSGIRFDYLMYDKDPTFFNELCEHHVSGQLKVAPEHVANKVLKHMGKPEHKVYKGFVEEFKKINNKLGKKQFIVPYLMSSHPGSDLNSAIELAEYLRDINHHPLQVQDFYPTPATMSTCMYYTEIDPLTMEKVYVPKTPHEKAMQRALIQYRNPKNYHLVKEALEAAGRTDLIGFDKKCLIRPKGNDYHKYSNHKGKGNNNSKGKTNFKKKKKTIRNVHKKKK